MPLPSNYEARISALGDNELLEPWLQIEQGNTPDWEEGKAFEYLILRAFQLEEAEVRWPYSVPLDGDEIEQIDGALYSDGLAALIECKDLSQRVNIEPIAKLRNQLLRRPSSVIGIIFSRSGFTTPAFTLARFIAPQTILLWSGEEVKYALENRCFRRGLVAKYRVCVEKGLPDYNIKSEGL